MRIRLLKEEEVLDMIEQTEKWFRRTFEMQQKNAELKQALEALEEERRKLKKSSGRRGRISKARICRTKKH